MNKHKLIILPGLFCSLFLTSPIYANDVPTPQTVRLLASQCAQCHGTTGNSLGDFDSIANENFGELLNELLEMKRDDDNEVMHKQIKGYTDDQIYLIADYYSRLPEIPVDERNTPEQEKINELDEKND